MSAASNNDFFYSVNEEFLGEDGASNNRVISVALNQDEANQKNKEHVIDIDRFSLNQNSQPYDANDSASELNITAKLGESANQDASNAQNSIKEVAPNFKKRNKFLSWVLGPSKAEKEYIMMQEANQRRELRKRARLIASQNKEQKIKVINDSSVSNDNITTSDIFDENIIDSNYDLSKLAKNIQTQTMAKQPLQSQDMQSCFDDEFSKESYDKAIYNKEKQSSVKVATSKDILNDTLNNTSNNIVRTYKPLNFSSYDENIKQLELKISHFNVVLGRNILPDRFKRKRRYAQSEPREELSEIDKLYLAAFSDVTIPEEDVDLDEDSVFIDDPVEMEDLFDLADESLTNSMESAIFSQISDLKRDISEDVLLEQEVAKDIAKKSEARHLESQKAQKTFGGLQKDSSSKVNLSSDFCDEDIARYSERNEAKTSRVKNSTKNDVNKRVTTRVYKNEAVSKDGALGTEANFIVRYSAFFIDIMFVSISCLVASFVIMKQHSVDVKLILSNTLYLIEFSLIFVKSLILITLSYYMISYMILQTSIGLKLLSYKLISEDGRKPKIRQILVRVLCMPINFLVSFGLLGKNSVHDKLSKTRLVKC